MKKKIINIFVEGTNTLRDVQFVHSTNTRMGKCLSSGKCISTSDEISLKSKFLVN